MSAFVWPLAAYTLTSPYGPRDGGFHYGDDLAAPLGTAIYASADGTVAAAGSASGFGCWIVLDHIVNGAKWSTVYGHEYPSGLLVHAGQVVKQGDHIGNVGANGEATGPHCHFEVWQGGRLTGGHAVNPSTVVNGTASGQSYGVQTVDNNDGTTGGVADALTLGVASKVSALWSFFTFLTNPHNWWRVFLFLVGLGALAFITWSAMNGSAK